MADEENYTDDLIVDKYIIIDENISNNVTGLKTELMRIEMDFKAKQQTKIRIERKPFPELEVFSQLANLAYKNLHQEKNEMPEGWSWLVTGRNDKNRYYGVAFINIEEQQIVIAHRGTNSFGAIKADLKSIVKNKISSHMLSAMTFTNIIISALPRRATEDRLFYQVSATGHSLGGWLSHVATFSTKYFKHKDITFTKDEGYRNNYHIHTVSFDNPGCCEMLNKLKDITSPRYQEETYGSCNILDINSYLSAPNRINSCNMHVGKIYRTFPDFQEGYIPLMDNYNLVTHRMDNIVKYLKDRSNRKGIEKMSDWPIHKSSLSEPFWSIFSSKTSEYDQLFAELNSGNNYHTDKPVKKIRYLSEHIQKQIHSINVLTQEEQNFLSHINSLKDDELVLKEIPSEMSEITTFLAQCPEFEEAVKFLLQIKFNMDDGWINCSTEQESLKVVNVTKQLVFYKPNIVDIISQQIQEMPSAHKKFCKFLSNQTTQMLNRFGLVQFQDKFSLNQFMSSEENKDVLCVYSESGELEMERIYKTLEDKESNVYLTWQQLKNCNKEPILQALFAYELVVLFADIKKETYTSFIDTIVRFKHKIIIVCKEEWIQDKIEEDIFKFNEITVTKIKSSPIIVGDLTEQSRSTFLELDIIFQGQEVGTLESIIRASNSEKRSEFINKQRLFDFTSLGTQRFIGCDMNVHSSLKLRVSIFNKEVSMQSFLKFLKESSKEKNSFVVTDERSSTFKDRYEVELKDYFSKIKFCDKENYNIFYETCNPNGNNENSTGDATVYWLNYSWNTSKFVCKYVYNENFYIKRKLMQKNLMSEQFATFLTTDLKTNHPETFKIVGSQDDFKSYLGDHNVKQDIKKLKHTIKWENEPIDENEKPVHTLKIVSDAGRRKMYWLKTEGSLKSIKDMVIIDKKNLLDEEKLDIILLQRIVIIADDAGMGKSTLLTSLSEKLVARHDWLIKIDLPSFTAPTLDLKDPANNIATIIKCLQGYLGEEFKDSITVSMFREDVETALFYKVYLIFDAFDEILELTDRINIVKMIRFLCEKTVANCWISTRKYNQDFLETELSTFALSIKEISETDQENYLQLVWKTDSTFADKSISDEFYRKQAKETLLQAKTLFSKDINSFVGNPLHLKLLADSLQPDITTYTNETDTPVRLDNIFVLYKKFLSNKFEIYFRGSNDVRKKYKILLENNFHNKFQELAFKSRFPTEGKDFFGKNEMPDDVVEELHRIGLIRTQNTEIKLFHETFVDYYCATLIVDWLNSHAKCPPIDEFLVTKIFVKEDYKYIRDFMNKQPIYNAKKLNVEHLWITKNDVFYNEKGETLIHILVKENQEHLLKYIFECCRASTNKNFIKKLLSLRSKERVTPLYVAMNTDNLQIVDQILYEMNEVCFRDDMEEIILATMFRSGEDVNDPTIQKLKDLINNSDYKFVKNVLQDQLEIQYWTLIHTYLETVRDKHCTLDLVKEKVHEVRTAVQRKYLMLSWNRSLKTALHIIAYVGNLQIIEYLLSAGCEIEVFDVMHRTPLHNAVESKQLATVQYLIDMGHSVNSKDETDMDPFLKSAKMGCLDILMYLIEKGADINSQDKYNINALLHAAKGGHLHVVKYLIEKQNMDIQYCDYFNITALSWAAQCGKLDVVKYIVKNTRADINNQDKNGMTALHHAAKSQKLKIVEYLLEAGADINISDRNKTSVLQRIIRCPGKKWEFVDIIIHKYDINYNIHDEKYSPLQKALQDNKLEIAKHMIDNGAMKDYLSKSEEGKISEML